MNVLTLLFCVLCCTAVDLAKQTKKYTKETKAREVSVSNIYYLLFTRSNLDVPNVIQNNNASVLLTTHFDPTKKTVFVAHGWFGTVSTKLNQIVHNLIFNQQDVNLFLIDWHTIADNLLYPIPAKMVPSAGEYVAQFINNIYEQYKIDGSSFVLIGFSLGGQLVGAIGSKVTKKVSHILALDPAGPSFERADATKRLDRSDADFVEVVHTDGSRYGLNDPLGHIDYYPNNGNVQPGCVKHHLSYFHICSHNRAYEYLEEALRRGPSVFKAQLCSTWVEFLKGNCANNPVAEMANVWSTNGTYGTYFLFTNDLAPYGIS